MLPGPRWWAPKGRGPWCTAPLAPPVWPPLAPALSSKCRQLGNGLASVRPSPPVCPINGQQQRQPADWLLSTSMHVRCGLQLWKRTMTSDNIVLRTLGRFIRGRAAAVGSVYCVDALAVSRVGVRGAVWCLFAGLVRDVLGL